MAQNNEKATAEIHDHIADVSQSWNVHDILPVDTEPWYKKRHLLILNLMMVVPYLSSTTNGYDGSMLNGLQSMTQWENFFNSPEGARLGSLSNGVIFGQVLAFPVAPWVSERFGRRVPIFFGSLLLVIGAVLQCAAQNYAMFLVARMILGFGGLIAVEASPTLITELAYPSHRGVLVGYYNNLWYLGSLMAAWITYGTYFMGPNTSWSWRIPSLLQGFFPLLQVLLVFFLPESPRYLVQKDRHEEARKILTKYHAGGDENSPLVDLEMKEIIQQIQTSKLHHGTGYGEFFKSRGNLHRLFLIITVPCMMQLSGNGLTSYYLSKVLDSIGIISSPQQLRINGGLQIFNFGTSIVLASFMEMAGRRRLFLLGVAGMLVSYVVWTVLSALNQERDFKDKGLADGVLAMIFMYQLFYNGALNGPPWVYVTEVLPTYLRPKGTNIMQLAGTCASIFNGYANPVAIVAIEWKYYIIYCCVLAVELALVYFWFPETKGRSLEEVALIFDGEQAFGVEEGTGLKGEVEVGDSRV